MGKAKLDARLVALAILPAALLETLNVIYNAYVPIYLQAGAAAFDAKSVSLTRGFGLGAALVGLWMTADNLLGFGLIPFVGARSDRTRSRLGRRLPWVLCTAPLVIAGYCLIPLVPTLIPPEANGRAAALGARFALFTLSCSVYYLGAIPQRTVLQALRQELVAPADRPRAESWATFLIYASSVLALTLGGRLYRAYGPLLFWAAAAAYGVSVAVLLARFREPAELAGAAETQEGSVLRQLAAVYRGNGREANRSLTLFLVSIVAYTLSVSALSNFSTSWMVSSLGMDESKAALMSAVYTVSAMVSALPAGALAGGRLGPKRVYVAGTGLFAAAGCLLLAAPRLYVVCFALLGVGLGGALATQLPLVAELCGERGNQGTLVGIYNLAYFFGYLLGANVVGWVIQATSYWSMFYVATPLLVLATVCGALIKTPGRAPRSERPGE